EPLGCNLEAVDRQHGLREPGYQRVRISVGGDHDTFGNDEAVRKVYAPAAIASRQSRCRRPRKDVCAGAFGGPRQLPDEIERMEGAASRTDDSSDVSTRSHELLDRVALEPARCDPAVVEVAQHRLQRVRGRPIVSKTDEARPDET